MVLFVLVDFADMVERNVAIDLKDLVDFETEAAPEGKFSSASSSSMRLDGTVSIESTAAIVCDGDSSASESELG